MLLFKKNNQTIKEKINELNILLATLENKEIKYSLIYNIDEDIILTITDKTSQRLTKSELKETKKSKKESE
jgi:hypothetical protein